MWESAPARENHSLLCTYTKSRGWVTTHGMTLFYPIILSVGSTSSPRIQCTSFPAWRDLTLQNISKISRLFSSVLIFFPTFFAEFFLDFSLDFFPDFFLDFFPDIFPDFFLDFLWKAAHPNLVTALDQENISSCGFSEHCVLIEFNTRASKRAIFFLFSFFPPTFFLHYKLDGDLSEQPRPDLYCWYKLFLKLHT